MRKIGFFGTPAFAANILSDLLSDPENRVVFAVTNPDKPVGRSSENVESPVSAVAAQNGIPLFKPQKVRTNVELFADLSSFDADYFIVAAYGKILPNEILDMPKSLCVNVHGSVLPKYRGASPIQESVRNGDSETGVTVMAMSEGMDEGDILSILPISIADADTSADLFEKFSAVSGKFLIETLAAYESGNVVRTPQNHEKATYCGKISKEDARAVWSGSAERLHDSFRAFQPWPGFHTEFRGKRLSIVDCQTFAWIAPDGSVPGAVFALPDGSPAVVCGEGALILSALKIEWKKAVSGKDFLNGYPDFSNTVLP